MSIADKLQTIAENEQKVFDAGKKAEYDAFWDKFQTNGNRADYRYAFAGFGWNDEMFKPKYPIKPREASGSIFHSTKITDIKAIVESNGIEIDFSNATNLEMLFNSSQVTRFGTIDTRGCKGVGYMLYSATKLKSVDKIILKEDGSQAVNNFAEKCVQLVDITIEGVIGQNGFTVQQSTKLSKSSWQSIINALSTTTSDLSITGSLASVKKAFETTAGANDGNTSAEWLSLVDTKKNWTISLI